MTMIHRNLNAQEARVMMVQTLRWREQFGVAAAMREEFPEDVFGKLGYAYGHDKEGRPVGCVQTMALLLLLLLLTQRACQI